MNHNFNADRGGRIGHNEQHRARDLEFHERGVYRVAKAHGHEVQGFFCRGPQIHHHGHNYNPTSSGVALAMKMADGSTVVLMRDPSTRATDGKWVNEDAMAKGGPNVVKIIVDGQEKDFKDIGSGGAGPHLGHDYALGSKVSPRAKGKTIRSTSYISQLSPKGAEKDWATSPLCVGDTGRNFLVDFSVPVLRGHWDMVYEASVTVFASDPDTEGSATLCGDVAMQNEIRSDPKPGYANHGSNYEVPLDQILFTSTQIAELCSTCNMGSSDSSLCTGTAKNQDHVEYKESFCDTKGYSYEAAESTCNTLGSNSVWYERCIIEQCASKGGSMAMMEAEMAFTEYLEKLQEER